MKEHLFRLQRAVKVKIVQTWESWQEREVLRSPRRLAASTRCHNEVVYSSTLPSTRVYVLSRLDQTLSITHVCSLMCGHLYWPPFPRCGDGFRSGSALLRVQRGADSPRTNVTSIINHPLHHHHLRQSYSERERRKRVDELVNHWYSNCERARET